MFLAVDGQQLAQHGAGRIVRKVTCCAGSGRDRRAFTRSGTRYHRVGCRGSLQAPGSADRGVCKSTARDSVQVARPIGSRELRHLRDGGSWRSSLTESNLTLRVSAQRAADLLGRRLFEIIELASRCGHSRASSTLAADDHDGWHPTPPGSHFSRVQRSLDGGFDLVDGDVGAGCSDDGVTVNGDAFYPVR